MNVKQKDIARATGVSIATVSRTLAGKYSNSSGNKQLKILRIAEELGYKKDIGETDLDIKNIKKIGLIIPRVGDYFFGRVLKFISDVFIKNYNYQVIFYCTNDVPEIEEKALIILMNQDIQGLIVVPSSQKVGI